MALCISTLQTTTVVKATKQTCAKDGISGGSRGCATGMSVVVIGQKITRPTRTLVLASDFDVAVYLLVYIFDLF